MSKEYVVILDTDGVLTDGAFWNDNEGKKLKKFGPCDWDALNELEKYADVHIISGDKVGFPIVEARCKRLGRKVDLISGKIPDRWEWMKKTYPEQKIIYLGDGLYDWHPIKKCDYGIVPSDALFHTKARANHIVNRCGANRFVAEACLHILLKFFNVNISTIGEPGEQISKTTSRDQ